MIKQFLIFTIVSCITVKSVAQQPFFSTIKVEFEKTTSVRALMKELQENNSWFEQNKDRYPVSMLNY